MRFLTGRNCCLGSLRYINVSKEAFGIHRLGFCFTRLKIRGQLRCSIQILTWSPEKILEMYRIFLLSESVIEITVYLPYF